MNLELNAIAAVVVTDEFRNDLTINTDGNGSTSGESTSLKFRKEPDSPLLHTD